MTEPHDGVEKRKNKDICEYEKVTLYTKSKQSKLAWDYSVAMAWPR